MRTTGLLKKESIELGVKISSKEGTINRLVSLMDAGGRLRDAVGYKEGILAREVLGGMAIGEGIAIPHTKVEAIKEPELAAVMIPEGVGYDAFNGSLASPLFMVAAPAEGTDVHLEALSRLSALLINPGFKGELIGAADKDEFLHIVDETEVERFGVPEGETGQNAKEDAGTGAKAGAKARTSARADASSGYRVLTITVCPTDIVCIYMAARSLENAGKKLGITLKAETDGSGGAQNVLTGGEIAATDAIIIAADRDVEMARFDGKPVIMVPIADGIHKIGGLIKRAMDGMVPMYRHIRVAGGESVPEGGDNIGWIIYKHLMNGVSHMPPFIIGGGILVALAFLFDGYSINPTNLGKNTPLTAYLKTAGEQAFGMMFPILAGFIAMSIADRSGLAVDLVAGLIAKTGTTSANPTGGGVSAEFLDALFAGLVDRYTVAGLRKPFSRLPKPLEGIKPVLLYPVIGIFLAAVITIFTNPYMDMINDGLTHLLNGIGGVNRIVPGMVLGGMMSIDMGGPFSKTAYVFGTAQLAEGNFEVMAVIMAGGMMPPITVTLCTSLSKKRLTTKERQSGIVSYMIGLSFITEGAIPFAAQDPLRVTPSYIIGSAITGELSMAFGCTLRAPHGGIFILPTIGNPFMYLVAAVVGAAAGCVILGMFKKSAEG